MTTSQEEQKKNDNQHLSPMGWDLFFQKQINMLRSEEIIPARVVGIRKNSFYVSQGQEEWLASAAGKLLQPDARHPVVGDWVLVADTVIRTVLQRKNELSRGAAGARGKREAQPRQSQIIAANLDTVWIVCGLDRDFNLRRIERYLTLVYNCGLTPAIILTKADLHADPERFAREVESVAFGVPVHLVSAKDSNGLDPLKDDLAAGRTVTMLGSSGAGKSTLLNRLYGQPVRATGLISEKAGKGRHVTTSRDLIMMPQGGMVIDNPGIREIAFWDGDQGLTSTFPEIERLAAECRFADCSHSHEPGCRVLAAIAEGELDKTRLASYLKVKRELMYLAERQRKSADRVEKERWKEVALKVKALKKRPKG